MAIKKHLIVTDIKASDIKFTITKFAGKNVYALKGGTFIISTLDGHYIVEWKDDTLTDGASVPDIFSCIRDGWYEGTLRDVGAITHDLLYTLKGQCFGRKLSRAECDELLQQIDLYTGATNKRKSWLVRIAVGLFAGSDRHWGADEFKQKDKITIEWFE